jgi:cold shock CspA family protein
MANIKWKMGKVRWFDEVKGEGLIRDEEGNSFYVHYSAIESDKKIRNLKKNKEVKFQLAEDSHYVQVYKVKEI